MKFSCVSVNKLLTIKSLIVKTSLSTVDLYPKRQTQKVLDTVSHYKELAVCSAERN